MVPSSKLRVEISSEYGSSAWSKNVTELTVQPNDEIEAKKLGKAPNLASITP